MKRECFLWRSASLNFSRSAPLELGSCLDAFRWLRFSSAGVPPAVLRCVAVTKLPAGRQRY
jgi:hypothetical protein